MGGRKKYVVFHEGQYRQGRFCGRVGTLAERPGVLRAGCMEEERREEQEGDWPEKIRGMSFDTQRR